MAYLCLTWHALVIMIRHSLVGADKLPNEHPNKQPFRRPYSRSNSRPNQSTHGCAFNCNTEQPAFGGTVGPANSDTVGQPHWCEWHVISDAMLC